MNYQEAAALGGKIALSTAGIITGKDDIIHLAVVTLFAGGNLLLDDVPGTGKTTLAKALACSCGCEFRRIQFTPDLLPSDLTGINYYNQKQGDFIFRKGPVFTNILLADEINRATPRTQSSLLECMAEHQVTADGTTYSLASPYFVIATQNPVETQGTFPLPAAQLDRFLVCTSVGYPATDSAVKILQHGPGEFNLNQCSPVCSAEEIVSAQEAARSVYVHPDLLSYIVDLTEKTRSLPEVLLGVSPRGSLALLSAAKANAVLAGRDFVVPEDIRSLAAPVFAHRIILKERFGSSEDAAHKIVKTVLDSVKIPSENWERK